MNALVKTAAKAAPTKALPKLYEGVAALDQQFEVMHKRGNSLQSKAHIIALSVLNHVGLHGDTTVVLRCINAMPEMTRTNGLRNWFEQFGPIKFVTHGEGKNAVETVVYVKGKSAMLNKAHAKPFWKFSSKEGQPYEPINLDTFVKSMVTKLETDAKNTGRDHTKLIHAIRYEGVITGAAASGAEVRPN